MIWVLKDQQSQQQEGREACPELKELPLLGATHTHFSSSIFQDLKELSRPWAGELSPGWRGLWWELSQSLTCGCCHGLECHLGIFKDSSQSLECRCRKDPQRVVSPVVPKLASSEPQCSPEAALGTRGTAAPLPSDLPTRVPGRNCKIQTASRLHLPWLLLVLKDENPHLDL